MQTALVSPGSLKYAETERDACTYVKVLLKKKRKRERNQKQGDTPCGAKLSFRFQRLFRSCHLTPVEVADAPFFRMAFFFWNKGLRRIRLGLSKAPEEYRNILRKKKSKTISGIALVLDAILYT